MEVKIDQEESEKNQENDQPPTISTSHHWIHSSNNNNRYTFQPTQEEEVGPSDDKKVGSGKVDIKTANLLKLQVDQPISIIYSFNY